MNDNLISDLKIDEIIWIIFIFLNIINIVGDECLISYYKDNKLDKNKQAKDIFTFSVFITLNIYIYLLYKRYKVYESNKIKNGDTKICGIRLFGTILVLVATVLFLYCQIEDKKAENPIIE